MAKRKKKNDSREVWDALIMVFQFGINMLVPIVLCTLFGAWLGKKFEIEWIVIPLFFVGALAGGNNIYKAAKRFMNPKDKK